MGMELGYTKTATCMVLGQIPIRQMSKVDYVVSTTCFNMLYHESGTHGNEIRDEQDHKAGET